jgi:hypothetical protein
MLGRSLSDDTLVYRVLSHNSSASHLAVAPHMGQGTAGSIAVISYWQKNKHCSLFVYYVPLIISQCAFVSFGLQNLAIVAY